MSTPVIKKEADKCIDNKKEESSPPKLKSNFQRKLIMKYPKLSSKDGYLRSCLKKTGSNNHSTNADIEETEAIKPIKVFKTLNLPRRVMPAISSSSSIKQINDVDGSIAQKNEYLVINLEKLESNASKSKYQSLSRYDNQKNNCNNLSISKNKWMSQKSNDKNNDSSKTSTTLSYVNPHTHIRHPNNSECSSVGADPMNNRELLHQNSSVFNNRRFSILDIASENPINNISKEEASLSNSFIEAIQGKKCRFTLNESTNKSIKSNEEAIINSFIISQGKIDEKFEPWSKELNQSRKRILNFLLTTKLKAVFLMLESKFLKEKKKISICLHSKKLYGIYKDKLHKDYSNSLIIELRSMNIKYPDKDVVKTELSNWKFRASLTTQLSINHMTQSSDYTIASLMKESQEVRSMIEIIFLLYNGCLTTDFTNSLIVLLKSQKASSLSKH